MSYFAELHRKISSEAHTCPVPANRAHWISNLILAQQPKPLEEKLTWPTE